MGIFGKTTRSLSGALIAAGCTVFAGACIESTGPERPRPPGNGADTVPPVIHFVAPTRDTTYQRVGQVVVAITVTDQTPIALIAASVRSTHTNFDFAPLSPDTTSVDAGFPIPVTGPDTVFFGVSATDSLGHATPSKTLRLEIQ